MSAMRQPGNLCSNTGAKGEGFEETFAYVLRPADTVHEFGLREAGDAEGR